jgi:hypothetical protein
VSNFSACGSSIGVIARVQASDRTPPNAVVTSLCGKRGERHDCPDHGTDDVGANESGFGAGVGRFQPLEKVDVKL